MDWRRYAISMSIFIRKRCNCEKEKQQNKIIWNPRLWTQGNAQKNIRWTFGKACTQRCKTDFIRPSPLHGVRRRSAQAICTDRKAFLHSVLQGYSRKMHQWRKILRYIPQKRPQFNYHNIHNDNTAQSPRNKLRGCYEGEIIFTSSHKNQKRDVLYIPFFCYNPYK